MSGKRNMLYGNLFIGLGICGVLYCVIAKNYDIALKMWIAVIVGLWLRSKGKSMIARGK